MMPKEKPEISLVEVDALNGADHYSNASIERFGYKSIDDFSKEAVVVKFRVSFKGQSFVLSVWFKKTDEAEDQWVRHARKIASEMVTWTHEVTKEWL